MSAEVLKHSPCARRVWIVDILHSNRSRVREDAERVQEGRRRLAVVLRCARRRIICGREREREREREEEEEEGGGREVSTAAAAFADKEERARADRRE